MSPAEPIIWALQSELCFGDFSTRAGLDVKARELLTEALLAMMCGAEVQAKSHGYGILKAETTTEDVVCALVHASGYMGMLQLFNALNACRELLAQE